MKINKNIFKIKDKVFHDKRGFLKIKIESDNVSYKESFSKKNVFRGLHIQIPPFAQSKYIWIKKGEVLDFTMNLNFKNNLFGKIKTLKLDSKSGIHFIPEYCAHGFLALKSTEFEYICIGKHNLKYEKTIKLSYDEYLKHYCNKVIMSDKDIMGYQVNEVKKIFKSIKW